MNSNLDYFTTTPKPVSTTTSQPELPTPCPNSVPVWVPAIFGVIGLLLGWGVTWLFMRRWTMRQRKVKKVKEVETEVNKTSF